VEEIVHCGFLPGNVAVGMVVQNVCGSRSFKSFFRYQSARFFCLSI